MAYDQEWEVTKRTVSMDADTSDEELMHQLLAAHATN
jgi:hypothetical protein